MLLREGQWLNTAIQSVRWGPGCLQHALPDALKTLVSGGGTKARALIITGNSLATKTDIIKRVESLLQPGQQHAATFSGIDQHANVEFIKKAQAEVERTKANVLIAVGGGSPIDAAKAISYWIHEQDHGSDDGKAVNYLPIVAIPTTLSLAETTQNAGFTRDGKKVGVSDPALCPRVIIYDSELTTPTPERLWISSGMRSLDHAIESLYRPDPNPLTRNQCLGAIRDLFHLLPLTKQKPDDLAIRQRLQLVCYTSLTPEARKGALGLSHSLGHALGATYSIPHGITSCLTLGPAIRLTAELLSSDDAEDDKDAETRGERLAGLSDALDYIPAPFNPQPSPLSAPVGSSDSPSRAEQARRGKLVGDAVEALVQQLGLATSLSAYKVPRDDLSGIAAHAVGKDAEGSEKHKAVIALLEGIY